MVVASMYPASRIVVKPINWGCSFAAQGSSARCLRPYILFCRIFALSASIRALRDLLFTVVIH